MSTFVQPDSDELQDDLFWQDELTEAMSWLSEGRDSAPIDVATLQRVLWPGAALDANRLQHLVDEGLVVQLSPSTFSLTECGRARGRMLLEADNRETLLVRDRCNAAGCTCCADSGVDVS